MMSFKILERKFKFNDFLDTFFVKLGSEMPNRKRKYIFKSRDSHFLIKKSKKMSRMI